MIRLRPSASWLSIPCIAKSFSSSFLYQYLTVSLCLPSLLAISGILGPILGDFLHHRAMSTFRFASGRLGVRGSPSSIASGSPHWGNNASVRPEQSCSDCTSGPLRYPVRLYINNLRKFLANYRKFFTVTRIPVFCLVGDDVPRPAIAVKPAFSLGRLGPLDGTTWRTSRQGEGLWEAISEYASRGLLIYFVLLFLSDRSLHFVVASLPFFPGEQAIYVSQSNQISKRVPGGEPARPSSGGIFANNLRIALIEMIPGLGAALLRHLPLRDGQDHRGRGADQGVPPRAASPLPVLFPSQLHRAPGLCSRDRRGALPVLRDARWLFATGGRNRELQGRGVAACVINFIDSDRDAAVAALFEAVELQLRASASSG